MSNQKEPTNWRGIVGDIAAWIIVILVIIKVLFFNV